MKIHPIMGILMIGAPINRAMTISFYECVIQLLTMARMRMWRDQWIQLIHQQN